MCLPVCLLQVMWGGTLFHVEDLPFQLPSMPPHYSEFRKAVCSLTVRAAVEAPQQVKGLPTAT
jgi:deoxyribodipyrimidine photo-lyase